MPRFIFLGIFNFSFTLISRGKKFVYAHFFRIVSVEDGRLLLRIVHFQLPLRHVTNLFGHLPKDTVMESTAAGRFRRGRCCAC